MNNNYLNRADGPIRVMIVDDHPIVREGIAAIIERREDMTVVAEVGNGKEAVDLCRSAKPDIVLMDLRMPVMDGVTATTLISQEYPLAKVIVLTTYDGDEDIYQGLRAGAKGYLLKDGPREALLEAIRAVHSGQSRIPPEIAAKLAERIKRPELTPRELEVLQEMAAGKSNQEIGRALYITEGTVKAHVNGILTKMGVNDRTQAVTLALERGIVRRNKAGEAGRA
jgi:two-component system NarL family response regulator